MFMSHSSILFSSFFISVYLYILLTSILLGGRLVWVSVPSAPFALGLLYPVVNLVPSYHVIIFSSFNLNRDLKFIYYTIYKKNEIICRVFVANTAPSCWPENWSPNNIKPHCLFLGMQPWILVLFSKCRLRILPH